MSPVAKYWDGAAWVALSGLPVYEQPSQPAEPVPQGAVWIDTDAPTPATYPRLLDVQTLNGNRELNLGAAAPWEVYIDGTTLLRLQYTPPVACWWELTYHLGQVEKVDAAYHYALSSARLTPADADGLANIYGAITQRSDVQQLEVHQGTRLFKLLPGVLYTAQVLLQAAGGTFRYWQGKDYLWLNGKAWAR